MEPRDTPLLTTSAKSNIGHTEACAGMIGLIKCVSMVSRSTADPNCHLNSLNPHLDVEGFPSVFETESVETRLNSNYAGVSSFGFSGTNARADVWSQCKSGPRKARGSRTGGGFRFWGTDSLVRSRCRPVRSWTSPRRIKCTCAALSRSASSKQERANLSRNPSRSAEDTRPADTLHRGIKRFAGFDSWRGTGAFSI